MTTFIERLKSSKNRSSESAKVYERAAKRLFLLSNEGDLPKTTAWLNNRTLKDKYEKVDLGKRRHLSLAAHIFAKTFGDKNEYWEKKMFKDSADYAELRLKNKKTPTEVKKWVDDALHKLKKAATEFKRHIAKKLKQPPSIAHLWLYTQYILMRFYSEIQLRNDLGNVSLKDSKNTNYLKKIKGGKYDLIMRDYKASNKIGEKIIHVSTALSRAIGTYIKYRNKIDMDHDWFLSNSKGQQLSKSAMGKALRKLTSEKMEKKIGTRMLRIFNASANATVLAKAAEIANNMLHSQQQSKTYIRKG
jgi:hypothetical protein